MPIGGQSLGKDVRIVLVSPQGTINIPPAAITRFNVAPETTNEKRLGLDGEVRHLVQPAGYKGSVDIDRFNSNLEDYWAAFEEAYYAGANIGWGYIQETIQNPDGSVSQWRYEKVVFDVKDFGDREGDKIVKMKLDFMASKRTRA